MNVNLNLILASLWLTLGAALLYVQWSNPQAPMRVPIAGLDVSLGWVAVALGVYNILRWGLQAAVTRRPAAPAEPHRRRSAPVQEPDPTFDFSRDPEPPAESGPPTRP
jgi:hypothetical protein